MHLFHTAPTLGAHFGVDRMLYQLKQYAYWDGMNKDVEQFIAGCSCANVKQRKPQPTGLPGALRSVAPNDLVAIDCTGPLPRTKQGFTHIIVVIDHFTRYVELAPIPQPTAAVVVDAIYRLWIKRYGAPLRLLSDNGREFDNDLLNKGLCAIMGVKKLWITPHHPQGDAVVERFMRTMKVALTMYTNRHKNDWDDHLDTIGYAYNTTMNDSIGELPYFVWFGRIPPAIPLLEPRVEPESLTLQEYKMKLIRRLEEAYEIALQRSDKAWQGRGVRAREGLTEVPWQVGDFAWLHNPGEYSKTRVKKLTNPWVGPYVVVEVRSPRVVVLYTPRPNNEQHRSVVSVDRLRRYVSPYLPTDAKIKSDTAKEIARILRRSKTGKGVRYQVEWRVGRRGRRVSWVPEAVVPIELRRAFEQQMTPRTAAVLLLNGWLE